MSRRLTYAALVGLAGATIIHIVILFLVPAYSERDAWSRLVEAGELFQLRHITGEIGDTAIVRGTNPFIRTLACRFEIDPGLARIQAAGDVPFWSVAIFDRKGQNIYSLNDRTSISNRLDLVIATPIRMVELRKDLPETYAESVFVELDANQGLAVIRIAVPDRSWDGLADKFASSATCSRA